MFSSSYLGFTVTGNLGRKGPAGVTRQATHMRHRLWYSLLWASTTFQNFLQLSKIGKIKIKLSKWQFLITCTLSQKHKFQPRHPVTTRKKVIAITNLKEPNSMDELYHFLGLTGYHRKVISLCTDIIKPPGHNHNNSTKFKIGQPVTVKNHTHHTFKPK